MTETAVPAEWQKGFPLEQLKALAAPFKERHRPLVFGAFGLTKERDIADAMEHKRAMWTGSPPQAVAITYEAKRQSDQQDFAQRAFVIPAGSAIVKNFAALTTEAGTKVLVALRDRTASRALFVEIFEEDTIAKACVEALGFAYMVTKISAGSEIKGVYTNGPAVVGALPTEDETTLEVLDPDFVADHEIAAIQAELAAATERFAQHYSDYNKRKSWTAFALRGYSDDPSFIIKPAEMSKSWKEEHPQEMKEEVRWNSAKDLFPATMKVVGRLGQHLKFDRVRFMRLRAKDGELSRHADITDREAGTADGFISRLHIPIRTSDAVTFRGWTARGEKLERTLPQGALCYLDQRKPHAVTNKDPSLDRLHLVLDCFADAELRRLIATKAPRPLSVGAAA